MKGLHSIRTKITAVTISSIILMMIVVTVVGVMAIRSIGTTSSEQLLLLLCESGQKNLNTYLGDVEQEVETISAYVEADLVALDDESLQAHLDRVSAFFRRVVTRTSGIMTYYYRIDPAVSSDVKGFWFVKSEDSGFAEHKVTDISLYDIEDTSKLVWFTVPRATGKAVWLPPYITDNLGARVISYNIPVYLDKQFVGVIGIELDYTFMAEIVDNITLYKNGYAFVNDPDGLIVYHPFIDILSTEQPAIPDGIAGADTIVRYKYDGVNKMLACLPLLNGDRLNVCVPLDEISEGWKIWVNAIIGAFGVLLVGLVIFLLNYTGHITKPLVDLTRVAEQIDEGNYDHNLNYKGNDEIGILTRTFSRVTMHLKKYITDLNDLAYADALTSLHNKGAFDACMNKIQTRMDDDNDDKLEFAVCIFDCNRLKKINDSNGHDKGDIYLKETAAIICEVFDHSPVFRIGGDEFAALLLDSDYKNKDNLLKLFDEKCSEKRTNEADDWEKIDVARGIAIFDPAEDRSVNDVIRRADKNMYENKFYSKRLG